MKMLVFPKLLARLGNLHKGGKAYDFLAAAPLTYNTHKACSIPP